MERRSKYGFFLLVFLIAGLALYGILHGIHGGGKTLVPAELLTTAPRLAASFEGNEGLADSLYLYKVVSVSGVFQQLIENGPGQYIVRLSGDPGGKAMVDCHMDSLYTREDLLLRTGDSVTIRGTCAGRWVNILLLQCIIEK
ncbi:MAG TPA: hypothetical protein VHE34_28845 [Puia sp.]|uniref:OB-fold protein n=1 Tax=Puia sp. TaxID=2045100 RepID=UPI002BC01C0B|nr:hypothetical protein [Puia sp.]HVU99278.1 hypothetical protein [Puia sp.]